MVYFDKEKDFKREIEPLLQKLNMKCGELELPFFVSVCTQNGIKGSKYETRISSAVANGYSLTEDRFSDYINITRGGYRLVKKAEAIVLDIDADN